MLGIVAAPFVACVLTWTPTPAPDYFTEVMAEVHAVVQEAELAEAIHERFHCLEDANGPYVEPPAPHPEPTLNFRTAWDHSAGVEQWRYLFEQYPWPVEQAMAIADCESGGNPNAFGAAGEIGIMQIYPNVWAGTYGPVETWYDPATNIAVAYNIWATVGDWRYWSCRRVL